MTCVTWSGSRSMLAATERNTPGMMGISSGDTWTLKPLPWSPSMTMSRAPFACVSIRAIVQASSYFPGLSWGIGLVVAGGVGGNADVDDGAMAGATGDGYR